MELRLKRKNRTSLSTIGELSVNGKFECFVLEDTDRGLRTDMSLAELKSKKIKTRTAIPSGKYEVIISFSNRFKCYLPLLLNVPAYEGIRIHPGNTAKDTEGCLLPGLIQSKDMVGNSRSAFRTLFAKMKQAAPIEKIFITIV